MSPVEALETYNQLQAVVQSDMADGTFELYKHDAIAGGLSALLTASGDFSNSGQMQGSSVWSTFSNLPRKSFLLKSSIRTGPVSDGADLFLGSAALHLIKSGNSTPELWRILLWAVLGYHLPNNSENHATRVPRSFKR